MALSKIPIVMKCTRCGDPLVVHIETLRSDPDGELFQLTIRAAKENALCEFHAQQKAWYAKQNRLDDWEKGRV